MEGVSAGRGTWLALRVGWGRPASMDSAARQASVRKKMARALGALGVSHSFMDRPVTPLGGFPKGAHLLQLIESSGLARALDVGEAA